MIKKTTRLLLIQLLITSPAWSANLSIDDTKWLNRINYGINSQVIEDFSNAKNRKAYLLAQLNPQTNENLPDFAKKQLDGLSIEHRPANSIALEFQQESMRIHNLPDAEKTAAHRTQNLATKQFMDELMQRHLLRAIYSPAQIKEQMAWFWFNHFNVYSGKNTVGWLIPDYEESAIRPHALGKFRDLLMATLQHPAMLIYLDNNHNAVNKINENYARELLELHSLGINGGYSQQDIQALSKILTGVGISWKADRPKIKKSLESYYLHQGFFEFNPGRHDFSDKQFLGKTINGKGFAEIEQVIDMLSKQPATAKFISRKLAIYWVSDSPPESLIESMAKTFQSTDGDITATLKTLFESPEFAASLGKKISDPLHFLLASLRFAYDGQPITDLTTVSKWLNNLAEPLYGHPTPDGYGMMEKDWTSPGQLTKRFEIAKQLVTKNLSGEDKKPPFKNNKLSNIPAFKNLEPLLSATTKSALEQAVSPAEWNIFLLSSPEFLYH